MDVMVRGKSYSAKILFQFRVLDGRKAARRRTCEERTILLRAPSPRSALAAAKRAGRSAQFQYSNAEGDRVHFEFIGVTDLLHLGAECAENEVWYEIKDLNRPMERRGALVPPDSELLSRAR